MLDSLQSVLYKGSIKTTPMERQMTRKQVIAAIQLAGIENDQRTFIRLYTENRISLPVAKGAFDQGRRAAINGQRKQGEAQAPVLMLADNKATA